MSEIRRARAAMWQAIEEARNVATNDRSAAEALLEGPAIALAQAVARCRARELASHADGDHMVSVAGEAAWASLGRLNLALDTAQIVRFLADRASHAVSDAARDADPLPRRARTYRNRVLTAARAARPTVDEAAIREVAEELYPQVTPRTMELIVHGAPPVVDVERPDVEASLTAVDDDPADDAVAAARIDAVHITVADQSDPRFRAWAEKVLGGENDGRRLPLSFLDDAAVARRRLAAWV